jgi:phosphate/sulfate permease
VALARFVLRFRRPQKVLAPLPEITAKGKRMHYDALRACVILSISASVIASASGLGLPVSTTYVSFAAIVATGSADRIFQRGDADLKLARTIWVIFSWFAAAIIAAVCAGLVCKLVYAAGAVGIVLAVGANLAVRQVLKRRADRQEQRVREASRERKYPERFAEEYED